MKKELEFIDIGPPTHKTNFLQHITDLIQIQLSEDETYMSLFERLRSEIEKNPEYLEAVEKWIGYNIQEVDPADLEKPIGAEGTTTYAIFNMYDRKDEAPAP